MQYLDEPHFDSAGIREHYRRARTLLERIPARAYLRIWRGPRTRDCAAGELPAGNGVAVSARDAVEFVAWLNRTVAGLDARFPDSWRDTLYTRALQVLRARHFHAGNEELQAVVKGVILARLAADIPVPPVATLCHRANRERIR